ncbi:MAG: hypothetical protein Q9173_001215 [Seirophora scorigena]
MPDRRLWYKGHEGRPRPFVDFVRGGQLPPLPIVAGALELFAFEDESIIASIPKDGHGGCPSRRGQLLADSDWSTIPPVITAFAGPVRIELRARSETTVQTAWLKDACPRTEYAQHSRNNLTLKSTID